MHGVEIQFFGLGKAPIVKIDADIWRADARYMRIGGNDTFVGIDNEARTIGFALLLRFENNFRRPLNIDDRGLEGCYFFRLVMLGVPLRILKKQNYDR